MGKVPLFVLGAGISNKRVAFINQMAERLVALIRSSQNVPVPIKQTLIKQGEAIQSGSASRSDAAEFFSTCQSGVPEAAIPSVWSDFCEELAIAGLTTSNGRFAGLFRLEKRPSAAFDPEPLAGPSPAHVAISSLLTVQACHVLNLNYDPLLLHAMAYLRESCDPNQISDAFHIIPLHSAQDIRKYYSSPNVAYQPSVVNARGDVFFARCTNDRCPEYAIDRSLDSRYTASSDVDVFRCTSCDLRTIKLQLSFPGYETKERLVQPILHQLREFLGFRTSVIVPIGLSGKWDPYLLSELFEWAMAYRISIVDVKPDKATVDVPTSFEGFRRRYFPSISTEFQASGSSYKQWPATADEFMDWIYSTVSAMAVFTNLPDLTSISAKQTSLQLR